MLLCAFALLNGCSTISGWFPDKQKQYKYSTEIPPLEIPPDLTSSTIEDEVTRRAPASESTAAARSEKFEDQSTASDNQSRPGSRKGKTQSAATLAQSVDDTALIEIDAPIEVAWNEVAKALGRLELEVSDRNRADGVYYVYFSPENKPYRDRGFFGDMVELFSGGEEPAKEYRIKLDEKATATSVYVLDEQGNPQNSGAGLELLKRLHETLKSLTEPKGEKSISGQAEESDSSE